MAIMRTCCCCGIRSGTISCAIYTIVIAVLGIGLFSHYLTGLDATRETLHEITILYPGVFGNLDIDAYILAVKIDYILAVIVQAVGFVTSIFAIVGVNQDSKNMLVPFIVAKSVALVWYVYAIAVSSYAVNSIGTEYEDAGGVAIVAELTVLIPFLITDIVCILCTLSQYQEYRDGRGRLTDLQGNAGVVTQTTVVVQQQQLPPGTGAFAYQHMQEDLPPAYSNPAAPVKMVPGAI